MTGERTTYIYIYIYIRDLLVTARHRLRIIVIGTLAIFAFNFATTTTTTTRLPTCGQLTAFMSCACDGGYEPSVNGIEGERLGTMPDMKTKLETNNTPSAASSEADGANGGLQLMLLL